MWCTVVVQSIHNIGILDPVCFNGVWDRLAVGFFGTQMASLSWLTIATIKGWPVSSAHGVVGGILGM